MSSALRLSAYFRSNVLRNGLVFYDGSGSTDGVIGDSIGMTSTFNELRVGLLGVGLYAYWPQFEWLKDRLHGYIGEVADRLANHACRACRTSIFFSCT
jgi:hypothetical protein